jgi:uncharacterized membrane protein YgdD (TMEM256/DUF423 family)
MSHLHFIREIQTDSRFERHLMNERRATDRMIATSAVLGLSAVALGAFGAHGLRSMIEGAIDASDRMRWWETAAQYHLAHALACGLAAWVHDRRASRASIAAIVMFTAGVIVFAGTLYAMALGAPRWLGAITPLGGLSLMGGWIALLVAALRRPAA